MDKILSAYLAIFQNYISSNKSSLLGGVGRVFKGEPYRIIVSDLPCIYIKPVSNSYRRYAGYTELETRIRIGYIQGIQNVQGVDGEGNEIPLIVDTVQVMEGTNSSGVLRADTVLGVVQNNTSLSYDEGGGAINVAVDVVDYSIQYDETSGKGNAMQLFEGQLDVTIRSIQSLLF